MRRRTFTLAAAAAALVLAAAGAALGRQYSVRDGDTLGRIAAGQLGDGSRWPEIARLNNLRSPYSVRVGQKLALPDSPASAAASDTPRPAGAVSPPVPAPSRASPPVAATMQPAAASDASGYGKGFLVASIGLLVIGCLLALIGWIIFLAAAFGQSFWWGLGSMLVPPVWIVFLAKHWEKARRGFICHVVGGAIAGASLFAIMLGSA